MCQKSTLSSFIARLLLNSEGPGRMWPLPVRSPVYELLVLLFWQKHLRKENLFRLRVSNGLSWFLSWFVSPDGRSSKWLVTLSLKSGKQRWMLLLIRLFLFLQFKTPVQEMVPVTAKICLSTSNNLLKIIPLCHLRRFVSLMIWILSIIALTSSIIRQLQGSNYLLLRSLLSHLEASLQKQRKIWWHEAHSILQRRLP